MDHHGEIPGFGGEGVILRRQHGHRDDDERVMFRDEKTAAFEIRHAALEIGDALAQPFFAVRNRRPVRQFFFRTLDPALPSGHHRVGHRAPLGPAVAGEWLVVGRIDNGLRHHRQAVAVGPIRDHIHVRLHEQHAAPGFRAQIEQGLTVVEVMLC